MPRSVLLVVVVSLLLALPALGDERDDRIRALEQKIEQLDKRIEALERRPTAPRARRPDPDLGKHHVFPVGDSPVLGPPKAPVKITVFSDLQCPFCARVHPLLEEAVNHPDLKGKVAVVFKHFPLSFHKDARPAAYATLAAREQGEGAFWKMMEACLENQRGLTSEFFSSAASRIGLDVQKFERAYRANQVAYDRIIYQDMKLGQAEGVRGTPSLFVGGYPLRTRSIDGIKEIIREHKLTKL